MSGIFFAVPLGVLLWGALLGWLVSPALSIVCIAALVAIVTVELLQARGERNERA